MYRNGKLGIYEYFVVFTTRRIVIPMYFFSLSTLPSDQGYDAHIAEINATFDYGRVNDLLSIDNF